MKAAEASMREVARAAIAGWAIRNRFRLVVLFGSLARHTGGPGSDVDLAIWPAGDPDAGQLLEWNAEVAGLSERPVQIVLVNHRLDPVLGFEIARDGKVIHEASEGIWNAERLKLWHALPGCGTISSPFAGAASPLRRGGAAWHLRSF